MRCAGNDALLLDRAESKVRPSFNYGVAQWVSSEVSAVGSQDPGVGGHPDCHVAFLLVKVAVRIGWSGSICLFLPWHGT